MVRYRLYSDRLKDAAKAGTADVYQYEVIPKKTRVQIRQLLSNAFGKSRRYSAGSYEENPAAVEVQKIACHEQGQDYFGHDPKSPMNDLMKHLETSGTETFLDTLEVACWVLENFVAPRGYWGNSWGSTITAEAALEDINFRLRDAGIGFQLEGGRLIRVDSQFAHAELVKPALALLSTPGSEGPQAEFLNAHEHYRAGRFKEAITDAAKAFESLMKAVCDKKGWPYTPGARASDLLKVLRAKKLWPDYLDASFDQLVATLASGLPKVRNEDGAHGQGATPKAVPSYVAAYALHLSAAKMILIVEAAK